MKIVCAWCKTIVTDGPPEPASHGMCQRCYHAILRVVLASPDPVTRAVKESEVV